jgi:hypothetical protein
VVGAVEADQAGDDPLDQQRTLGEDGLQDGPLTLERHDVACIGVTIDIARDVRHRLAGLTVDRDAIGLKGDFGAVVGDDLAVPGHSM